MPQTSPDDSTPPQRALNAYALAAVLLLHVALLIAVLWWRAQPMDVPASQHRTEITLLLPKPPIPPKPDDAGAKPSTRPSLALPAAKSPELQLTLPPREQLVREAIVPVVSNPDSALVLAGGLPGAVSAGIVGGGGTGGAGTGPQGAGRGGGGSGQLFADCADTPDRPMVAQLYRLSSSATSVADMARRKPVKTVCLAQLDITPRSFRQGFPGVDDLIEWFGLDIRFTVNVPGDGPWDMTLLSDDGAVLSIDGVEVINNDGLHSARSQRATVTLAQGPRQFRVRYFQGPRDSIALVLALKRPEATEWRYLPANVLARPQAVSPARD